MKKNLLLFLSLVSIYALTADIDLKEIESIQGFLKINIEKLGADFEWREKTHIDDNTHSHRTYNLYYKNRRVVDEALKLHYQKGVGVQYSSSSFEKSFSFNVEPVRREFLSSLHEKIKQDSIRRWKTFNGKIKMEPVIWVDPKTKVANPAIDVILMNERPMAFRHFIVDEKTGEIIEEKKVARQVSATVPVYKVSPFGGGSTESVTLSDLNSSSQLKNSQIWVRREGYISSTSSRTIDVTPQDYTGSFSTDPTLYSYTCSGGGSTDCPNQAFNAVNVYYHLSQYRSYVQNYFTQLGASVNYQYDPLNVVVNSLSVDLGEGLNDSNNALYVGQDCRADGSMPRCMIFLRPATIAGPSTCGSGNVQFYDLAREAIVVSHEYQHYVTDMVTNISFSSTTSTSVGDAIHEGYSDYLAASYVSNLAGRDVTLVGEYALQNCAALQRELGTLKVYQDNSAAADPHISGQTWATVLWKIRTEYGREITDRIALKSLFFLSTRPGFVEAIDSLLRADIALYDGVHVARLQALFYLETGFTGSAQYGNGGGVEVGFKGCAVDRNSNSQVTIFGFFCSLFLWLALTLFIGKRKAYAK